MNLNSDLAEGAGHDEEILGSIDSANVACGVHAGSMTEMTRIAKRCAELGVEVGAHPGYDDRDNYGRVETGISAEEFEALVAAQVAALAAVVSIGYIKAHGALYHRADTRPVDLFIMATDADAVYLDWGTPRQRAIRRASPRALAACSFAGGSMGPKVEAAIDFTERTGKPTAIGALADIRRLAEGEAGTRVTLEAREIEIY